MKQIELHSPLDLLEVRRQLVALRSLHSHETRVTTAINLLLGKLAHLRQPENQAHEERLIQIITETIQSVEKVLSGSLK